MLVGLPIVTATLIAALTLPHPPYELRVCDNCIIRCALSWNYTNTLTTQFEANDSHRTVNERNTPHSTPQGPHHYTRITKRIGTKAFTVASDTSYQIPT